MKVTTLLLSNRARSASAYVSAKELHVVLALFSPQVHHTEHYGNMSASPRGFVEAGHNEMIGGLIVGSSDRAGTMMLVRAVGRVSPRDAWQVHYRIQRSRCTAPVAHCSQQRDNSRCGAAVTYQHFPFRDCAGTFEPA